MDYLLFAVPKKGRLFEKVNKLLHGAGLEYSRPSRVDIAICDNIDVKIVFLPAADIAAYVADGKIDMGITGQDIIAEYGAPVHTLEKLGFGKCRLGVQAPVGNIQHVAELAGKRIVTSFPSISAEYFKQFENDSSSKTSIKYVSGSVEAACGLGLADAVVDLIETGTTMHAAGLELVSTVLTTEAVLIANPHSTHPKLVQKIHQRILGYMTAKKYMMITYNVSRDNLAIVQKITPGRKAPTITPLADNSNCVSVSAMVETSSAASIMDQLVEAQASDIILLDIANCRA